MKQHDKTMEERLTDIEDDLGDSVSSAIHDMNLENGPVKIEIVKRIFSTLIESLEDLNED
jgi:hypothetical protein